MEDGKYPYQSEWEKYRERNSLGCLAVPVIIALILFIRHFSPQWLDYIGGILLVIFLPFAFFWRFFEKDLWNCPRCQQKFDDYYRTIPTKKCVNCDLPIYFGSSYFYDYWGTEKGNELAEKINKEEK